MISGRVYAQFDHGEPYISGAAIEAREADGTKRLTVSDGEGFYRLAVRPGPISITASKRGYEAETSRWMLFEDTILNFGLNPL